MTLAPQLAGSVSTGTLSCFSLVLTQAAFGPAKIAGLPAEFPRGRVFHVAVAHAAAAGLVIEITATVALESKKPTEQARTGIFDKWLPIVDSYRTLCIAPPPEVRAAFEAIQHLDI